MDVNVAFFNRKIDIKHRKRKFVLHDKGFVALLNCPVYYIAFYVPFVYKVIFKSTVAPCDKRLADIAVKPYAAFILIAYLN